MSIKTALFGRVDLDTVAAISLARMLVPAIALRRVDGKATEAELADPNTWCFEVGGSGRTAENNYDHHEKDGPSESTTRQICHKFFGSGGLVGRLVDYVDQVDCGDIPPPKCGGFPSLAQLFAGLLLSVRDPIQQVERGIELLRHIVENEIDPYGSMDKLLDEVPGAREWARTKREHDAKFADVLAEATWFSIIGSRRVVAVVETQWFGAPGALYGYGAHVVVCCNPTHGDKQIRKMTVAVRPEEEETVDEFLRRVSRLEEGWGGPEKKKKKICGSPQDRSSALLLEVVADVVIATM